MEGDTLMLRRKEAMLIALRKSHSVAEAAKTAGITRASHYRWCKTDKDYQYHSRQACKGPGIKKATRKTTRKEPKTGYVYIIRCVNDNWVKIGMTTRCISVRVSAMQTGVPYMLEVLDYVESEYPRALENTMHKLYSHRRGVGEWFKIYDLELPSLVKTLRKWNNETT